MGNSLDTALISSRTKSRERLLATIAIVLALLVVFAVAEIGLRLYARASSYTPKVLVYHAPHHYLGTALVPNASYVTRTRSINVNSKGFRGKEFSVTKPAGVYRIFALGGSTTFGFYPATTSDDTAYPAILEEFLNREKPDPEVARYEVVNAGVPGYSVRTSTQNFISRILFFQPDMVVIQHLINDMSRYGREEGLVNPLNRQFVPNGIAAGFMDHMMGWSYAFQELRYTLGVRLVSVLVERTSSEETSQGQWSRDVRYEEIYRRGLRNLVILAKANGVAPILTTMSISITAKTDFSRLTEDENRMGLYKQAFFYSVVPPQARYALFKRYNEVIREVAQEQNIIVADADSVIPKTSEFHFDVCHLTDKGSALQAQVIHRAILENADRFRAVSRAPKESLMSTARAGQSPIFSEPLR